MYFSSKSSSLDGSEKSPTDVTFRSLIHPARSTKSGVIGLADIVSLILFKI